MAGARLFLPVQQPACAGAKVLPLLPVPSTPCALAQSMTRELWSKGIHVGHPIIDGAIDTEFIRSNFPDRYRVKNQQGIVNPDSIAEAYWQIHQQPRDAWTHETELRPWLESW